MTENEELSTIQLQIFQKSVKTWYFVNLVDNLQEDEEEEQAAEEEEARMIQRRMAEALDEGDFDIDDLQVSLDSDTVTSLGSL